MKIEPGRVTFDLEDFSYIFMECEVCGKFTVQRYMTNDIPICRDCMDTPEFLEWLRVNRPIFYDFEMAE